MGDQSDQEVFVSLSYGATLQKKLLGWKQILSFFYSPVKDGFIHQHNIFLSVRMISLGNGGQNFP